jgi:hypothetical protein
MVLLLLPSVAASDDGGRGEDLMALAVEEERLMDRVPVLYMYVCMNQRISLDEAAVDCTHRDVQRDGEDGCKYAELGWEPKVCGKTDAPSPSPATKRREWYPLY